MLVLTMQLVRTSLKIKKGLKSEAEKIAREKETTLQNVFNDALEKYIFEHSRKKAKRLWIPTIDLGVPLDNIARSDIYGDMPKKFRSR